MIIQAAGGYGYLQTAGSHPCSDLPRSMAFSGTGTGLDCRAALKAEGVLTTRFTLPCAMSGCRSPSDLAPARQGLRADPSPPVLHRAACRDDVEDPDRVAAIKEMPARLSGSAKLTSTVPFIGNGLPARHLRLGKGLREVIAKLHHFTGRAHFRA